MESHLSKLPDKCFSRIIDYLGEICHIEKLKNTYPILNNRINKCLKAIISIEPIHLNFLDYIDATNLLYSSGNILFDIRSLSDLLYLKKFKIIRNINFYISTKLNSEFDSIQYFESMLKYINIPTLKYKTYRLIFRIQIDNRSIEYAYILDRGRFTIANINQFRGFSKTVHRVSRIEMLRLIYIILNKYFPNNIYDCIYSTNCITNLYNNKIIDITIILSLFISQFDTKRDFSI